MSGAVVKRRLRCAAQQPISRNVQIALALLLLLRPVCYATPASRPAMTRDFQYREDCEAFREWTYRYGDKPSSAAVERMVNRAKDYPNEPEPLLWAGRAEQKGLVPKGHIDGLACYRRAADLGYLPAMAAWGAELCSGNLVPRDVQTGMKLLQQAADRGNAAALYSLGAMHALGAPGVPRDLDSAERNFNKSLEKGFLRAAHNLAVLYQLRGDVAEMVKYVEVGADGGDAQAMRDAARYYRSRTSPPLNTSKAAHFLLRGALWGDPGLMRAYGQACIRGDLDIKKDEYLGVHLLRRAARQGDEIAQGALAEAYAHTARSAARGYSELERLVRTSQGESRAYAQAALGMLLYSGENIAKDQSRGRALVEQSARYGLPDAKQWLEEHKDDTDRPIGQNGALTRPAAEDEQFFEDAGQFDDWIYGFAEIPSAGAVQRTIDRARGKDPKPRALAYASLAGDAGWASDVGRDANNHWLRLAVESKDALAMALYGNALFHGAGGFARNPPEGLKLMQEAADLGEREAYLLLAQAYQTGAPGGFQSDLDRAEELFQQAAGRGVVRALGMLGNLYRARGNSQKALEYFAKAATVGDNDAMWALYVSLAANRGKDPNANQRMRELCVRGALWGDPRLMAQLGLFFSDEDIHLKRLLVRRAAAAGVNSALTALALWHITGEVGSEQDVELGRYELELLAKDPERAMAQWILGSLLYEGKAIPRDTKRGRELIEQAAAHDNDDAQKWLKEHGEPVSR